MVLPKIIYENMPYGYFIISGYLLSIGEIWPIFFSAALFYGAACITFVVRSANRRLDKNQVKSIKRNFPEIIYEYMPYSFSALAVFIFMATTKPMFQFIAFTLFVIALRNLMCRHNNRSRKPSKF